MSSNAIVTDDSGIGFSEEDEFRPPKEAILHPCKVPRYTTNIGLRELYYTAVEWEARVPLPSLIAASVASPAAVNKQVFPIERF